MSRRQYRAILADLDGTVNRGRTLLPGARETYLELSSRGIGWIFLSNNATVLASDLAEGISRLGLAISERQVLNSALALIHGVRTERAGSKVLVVGETKLVNGLTAAGVRVIEDPQRADIVVAAMDRQFNYDKLKRAQAALLGGALFWATNTDAALPVEDGLLPGAGSIVAAIGTAAGRAPDRVFGKPSPDMAYLALALLGLPAESCLVVGDRMETDILFARNAGMDSALVLTGAASRGALKEFPYAPDHVLESIADLSSLFYSERR
ncbi:MAG: HAD-IIA family hydrolase [Deltaproteobacteria bacterium]|nr:HAD-IIA family hydrolase [Deltaproteobacteria bacterium]